MKIDAAIIFLGCYGLAVLTFASVTVFLCFITRGCERRTLRSYEDESRGQSLRSSMRSTVNNDVKSNHDFLRLIRASPPNTKQEL